MKAEYFFKQMRGTFTHLPDFKDASIEEAWKTIEDGGFLIKLAYRFTKIDYKLIEVTALLTDTARINMRDIRVQNSIHAVHQFVKGKIDAKTLNNYFSSAVSYLNELKAYEKGYLKAAYNRSFNKCSDAPIIIDDLDGEFEFYSLYMSAQSVINCCSAALNIYNYINHHTKPNREDARAEVCLAAEAAAKSFRSSTRSNNENDAEEKKILKIQADICRKYLTEKFFKEVNVY